MKTDDRPCTRYTISMNDARGTWADIDLDEKRIVMSTKDWDAAWLEVRRLNARMTVVEPPRP